VSADPRGQPEHGHEENGADDDLGNLDCVTERHRMRENGAVEETPIPPRRGGGHLPKLVRETLGESPRASFVRPETSHS
jgi:hypothetical protein